MSIEKNIFINSIADIIQSDQVSVFIGAGISTELGLPSLRELLAPCAKKLNINIDDCSDYYTLAQYYANSFGKNALKRKIACEFQLFHAENDSLNALFSLDLNSIWTTNYDTAIENSLMEKHIRFSKVYADQDLANISSSETPIVYKLNGDIHNPENLVLTKDDWENYEHTHPMIITFLKKELVSNTFLFLGYSFSDNLILKTLSEIKRFVGCSCNTHYTIMKDKQTPVFHHFIDDLYTRYHIQTVLVKEYDEIPITIKAIQKKIIERNVFISGRLDDQPEEIENYACELGRSLSVSLLENKYNICTGMGRKIGYFIAGPAIQYLLEQNTRRLDQKIKLRPFDDGMNASQTLLYRENLLSENHVAIFIFGQKNNPEGYAGSSGVSEEFEIAKKMKKVIIPVGATGFEAELIWREVKENIIHYPYLEGFIDKLGSTREVNDLSKLILEILEQIIE